MFLTRRFHTANHMGATHSVRYYLTSMSQHRTFCLCHRHHTKESAQDCGAVLHGTILGIEGKSTGRKAYLKQYGSRQRGDIALLRVKLCHVY
jgi:hypothetical protein